MEVKTKSSKSKLAKKRSEAEKLYPTIIHKYNKNGWISDTKESMRNGRRVISIFAEQKRTPLTLPCYGKKVSSYFRTGHGQHKGCAGQHECWRLQHEH